jgi:hypothetical protein
LFASHRDFRRFEAKIDSLSAEVRLLYHDRNFIIRQEAALATSLADIKAALDAQGDKLTALADRIREQANSGAPDPTVLQAIADELNAHNASIDALDVPEAPPAPPPLVAVPAGAPVINTVTPTGGKLAGGDTVQIGGSNLAGVTTVSFGGVPAPTIISDSGTLVTVASPAAEQAGQVDLVVSNAAGQSAPVPFTYA